MKIKRNIFWIITCFLFLLKACKSIEPKKPEESYIDFDQHITKNISTVNIPIEIDLNELEQIVNNEINNLIYEDESREHNTSFKIKVWKKSPITVNANGDLFETTVPLKIYAKIAYELNSFGINLSDTKETEFELDMHYITKLMLSPDWKLETETTANKFDWKKKPVIQFGKINIPLSSILSGLIENQQEIIAKEIDYQIQPNLHIKRYVADAWEIMQKPYKFSDDYDGWLKLTPTKILLSRLHGKGKKATIALGIQGYTETFIGQKPQAIIDSQLPDFTLVDSVNNQFTISLNSQISHKQINRILQDNFLNQSFTYNDNKNKISITNIELFGSWENLVVETHIEGSINGKLYLKGKPVFSPVTESIYIENLDFDLDTKNKLVKTASWLTKSTLLDKMKEKLTFPLRDQLKHANKMIQHNLNKNEVAPGIVLNGNLKELSPSNIYITPESIIAIIQAKGNADLVISEFQY